MPRDLIRPLPRRASRPEEAELFRPVELLAKLFEGPEGGHAGLEDLLDRLEWKETTR
ncbi:hypothetical protein SAMN06297129_2933 [Pseudooceanicola antarcticus]|uniref:Uncharacterized protein n=1 Tax=Pseudooceanicola antarcticus TaxID=1247613 RepID=A0A285J3V5_9RHOB|nr:hypothetical protein [Pseudooceanicola antarcticus]SNY54882.1 hypothetical protein SAMN06297129_2933 [Pseudooceanicola antarcticus]